MHFWATLLGCTSGLNLTADLQLVFVLVLFIIALAVVDFVVCCRVVVPVVEFHYYFNSFLFDGGY